MSGALLEAEGVSLAYGSGAGAHTVLRGVDLRLAPGEVVSVIGPSGAGKSSVLRLMAGLQQATSGAVRIRGEILVAPHPRIAVAFQDASLLPWLSVEHNVGFGLGFRRQPAIGRSERQRRVAQTLEAVGLGHARQLYPAQLSGGMAQRVALARCLARQPQALLLDEPFGALDEITRGDMQALLLRIVRDFGPATLLITHDIDEALLLSDRVVLLGGMPGEPARVTREWRIALPHPRASLVDALGALRVDIVRHLRRLLRPDEREGGPAPQAPQALQPIPV
ncbi:ABC transporter ATP-binding protein [Cupriavidus basilensis]|uniref:ABC transporter ATP-binding protein n=1 Tax=Cupriavidus basilensis TaxID=68895 RepID=A0ABT6AK37_9BURK|nr:ABC transporter ATP-binding protein [Cupriavidus basilensis]MDF3832677.1 ABC transporter ATP-binding protein [Cupriavidus basilensis]